MDESFFSIGDSIPSLEDIAAIQVSILVCCVPELKREILCTNCVLKYKDENRFLQKEKGIWNEIIEDKTRLILRKLRLPETLQEKMISAVFAIGMKMVIWAEYHERTLAFSREFSLHFLNGSLFTTLRMIDSKKAAGELMNVECLTFHQKYKIACIYCFVDYIPFLFLRLSIDDKKELTSNRQPGLVRFWSRYSEGELDKIEEKFRDQYLLKKAVDDGSKAAVEYCFQQLVLKRKEFNIVYAALEAVRNGVKSGKDDWNIIFNPSLVRKKDLWVPTDYYVDIVFFLLSKMREDEQIEFLQEDIDRIKYRREPFFDHYRILQYLLEWPYQNNFMKTANLVWDFLPERNYAVLLLKICDKIEPRKWGNVNYGEEKFYDFRRLLMKFWHLSPARFKRYVFSKQEKNGKIIGEELLSGLFTLKNFTNADAKIIELILASALDEEKENISATIKRGNVCIKLMGGEKWRSLDLLVANCFATKEAADKFKSEFIFTEDAQIECIDLMLLDNRIDSIDSALKWSGLPEKEIDKLKKEIINSWYGRQICENLIVSHHDYETVINFLMWCYPSEEEFKTFKKEIAYTRRVMRYCAKLVANEATEVVDKFIHFFFSSGEEIKQFRKDVAYRVGGNICQNLISHKSYKILFEEQQTNILARTYNFHGGKWEEVEKFLTWCFSSEKEINDFKRQILKMLRDIHHDLIQASQFEEAERYFAWLGLSAEEIKDLKKDDFFNTYMIDSTFLSLFFTDEAVNSFSDFGGAEEAIELLLRWYLTDRETVLEFSSEFKLRYLKGECEDEAKVKDAFKKFDLAIAQRLSDLGEEKIGMKRKSNNSPSRKRFAIKILE